MGFPMCVSILWTATVYGVTLVIPCQGHGRLLDPPGRASMWRFGFKTPINFADNQLFCGGYTHQWQKHGGKCGVCGDAWDDPIPRPHEAGGKYATGTVVRKYKTASVIPVAVDLTAPHRGYFEFRLCSADSLAPGVEVTQECLDGNLLSVVGSKDNSSSGSSKFMISSVSGQIHRINLQLPANLTCTRCVFQWKYNTGNSWGVDKNGHQCLGCGPQEQFYACADVAIGDNFDFDLAAVTAAAAATVVATTPTTTSMPLYVQNVTTGTTKSAPSDNISLLTIQQTADVNSGSVNNVKAATTIPVLMNHNPITVTSSLASVPGMMQRNSASASVSIATNAVGSVVPASKSDGGRIAQTETTSFNYDHVDESDLEHINDYLDVLILNYT